MFSSSCTDAGVGVDLELRAPHEHPVDRDLRPVPPHGLLVKADALTPAESAPTQQSYEQPIVLFLGCLHQRRELRPGREQHRVDGLHRRTPRLAGLDPHTGCRVHPQPSLAHLPGQRCSKHAAGVSDRPDANTVSGQIVHPLTDVPSGELVHRQPADVGALAGHVVLEHAPVVTDRPDGDRGKSRRLPRHDVVRQDVALEAQMRAKHFRHDRLNGIARCVANVRCPDRYGTGLEMRRQVRGQAINRCHLSDLVGRQAGAHEARWRDPQEIELRSFSTVKLVGHIACPPGRGH